MSTIDEWASPLKSIDTRRVSSQAMIPLRVFRAAFIRTFLSSSVVVFVLSSAVKSTTETVGVGTRSE